MSLQSDKPASPASSPEPQATPAPRGLACIFCQQRKVKCDRQRPCAACTKARVACTYRTRQAPRRRHNRATEVSLRARLGRLEELLKTAVSRNENPEFDDMSSRGDASTKASEDFNTIPMQLHNSLNLAEEPKVLPPTTTQIVPGQLVSGHGKSRYIENKLWNKIYEQLKDTQELLDEESSDEEPSFIPASNPLADPDEADLTFGTSISKSALRTLHPHPAEISFLWTAFAENVNPLIKVIHGPTTQALVNESIQNLDSLGRGVSALLFAIYLAAATSLTEQECISMLGEPKAALIGRYKYAAQKALLNASYLKSSDMTVLQAFVVYLLAVRPYYDARTFWAISGLAARIAQRIGIHKDGSNYNLPPFEVEMRRRLWWQTMLIDVRAAEVCGAGLTAIAFGDTKRPLNINDDDLYPEMTEPPVEREGTTEMCFVMLRSSIGRYFKYIYKPHLSSESGTDQKTDMAPKKSLEELMNEFETHLHDSFLKNADPLNPLQFFTSMVAQAILCSWRVMDCIRRASDKANPNIQSIRNILFEESLKGIEYDNLGHTTKNAQRFLWHINSHFQWHSFITLLGELRFRTTGELVERAWQQVGEVYEHHPDLLHTRNPLHTAVGNLTVAAWEAREAEFARRSQTQLATSPPFYVLALRQQRLARQRSVDNTSSESPSAVSTLSPNTMSSGTLAYTANFGSIAMEPAFDPSTGVQDFAAMPLDSNQMDWNEWDRLLQNYEPSAAIQGGDFSLPKDPAFNGFFQ